LEFLRSHFLAFSPGAASGSVVEAASPRHKRNPHFKTVVRPKSVTLDFPLNIPRAAAISAGSRMQPWHLPMSCL
jgi:hypothetical protein